MWPVEPDGPIHFPLGRDPELPSLRRLGALPRVVKPGEDQIFQLEIEYALTPQTWTEWPWSRFGAMEQRLSLSSPSSEALYGIAQR